MYEHIDVLAIAVYKVTKDALRTYIQWVMMVAGRLCRDASARIHSQLARKSNVKRVTVYIMKVGSRIRPQWDI